MPVWGMQDQYKQTLRFASYHAGGVALATALLLGVMGGGFLAGLLAMPLVVIGMGGLAVAHEMQRRRALVTPSATTTDVPRRERLDGAVVVVATVAEAKGVCPRGYRFYVGQNWSVDGDPEAVTGICPAAAEKLEEACLQLRQSGRSAIGVTICQSKAHKVVFQLQRQPVEYADQMQSPESAQ